MSKIYNLQLVRGIAASLVVIDHALGYLIAKGGISPDYDKFRWQLGSFGVSIFFVLSGFVMVYTSDISRGGLGSGLNFLLKRFFRIFPIYFIATSLMIFGSKIISLNIFLKSIFFIPITELGKISEPLLGQGWTLNYEIFFYILFSISFLISGAIRYYVLMTFIFLLVFIGFCWYLS